MEAARAQTANVVVPAGLPEYIREPLETYLTEYLVTPLSRNKFVRFRPLSASTEAGGLAPETGAVGLNAEVFEHLETLLEEQNGTTGSDELVPRGGGGGGGTLFLRRYSARCVLLIDTAPGDSHTASNLFVNC